MNIVDDIVLNLAKIDVDEGISRDEIFESLNNNYSRDDFEKAMALLTEKVHYNNSALKCRNNLYKLSSFGVRLSGFYDRRWSKYKSIEDWLLSHKEHQNIKNSMLENADLSNEIQKAVLQILLEKEELDINEIIAILAELKNKKKNGDPYLFAARSIIEKMRLQEVVKLEDRKYSITPIGIEVLKGNATVKDIYEAKNVLHLKRLIRNGVDLSSISIAALDNLNGVFDGYRGDLKGIETWNVSNIEQMKETFKGADLQGVDLSTWNVSNLVNLDYTFKGAKNISGIENWQTKSLETMDNAFENCEDFNLDLSNWRTERLKSLNYAFKNAISFEGYRLNDWHLNEDVESIGVFKGAKSSAEWAGARGTEEEFYIVEYEGDIPENFVFCNSLRPNDIDLKRHLNSGVNWLRDEIQEEIKFYFKDKKIQNVNGRILWSEAIVEIFGIKYHISKTKTHGVEAFVIYLNKLENDEYGDIESEEDFVNPLIRLISRNNGYSTGQNDDDIYFGYKGIFVDSKRFSLAMRTMVLYLLARAYKQKLEDFIASSAKKHANLAKINELATKFNLEKYFPMPVITSEGALQAGIWAKIFDLYELDHTQNQVGIKIRTMASILSEKRAKMQQYIIAIASIFVSIAVGVVPLLQ